MGDRVTYEGIGRDCEGIGKIAHKLHRTFQEILVRNAFLEERVVSLEQMLKIKDSSRALHVEHGTSPKMLSQKDVVARWRVSKSTFYHWRKHDPQFPIPVFKGHPVRFWIHEIEAYERGRTHPDRKS